jgi:hypothetical protein
MEVPFDGLTIVEIPVGRLVGENRSGKTARGKPLGKTARENRSA